MKFVFANSVTRKHILPIEASSYWISIFLLTFVFLSTTTMSEQKHETQVANANTAFALKMYQILSKQPNENVFFSPLSLHAVLSMAYQGVAGRTLDIFAEALGVPNKQDAAAGYKVIMKNILSTQDVTLLIANKIFLAERYELKAEFEETVTTNFLSEVQNLNFEDSPKAAATVNSWVKEKTKEKITQLFTDDAFDSLTRLVLVNAIYFKGDWLDKFKKDLTRTEPFFIDDDNKIDCQMMHRTGKYNFKSDESLQAKILEIPYRNKNTSMFILLPEEKSGIANLEAKLATADISTLFTGMHYIEVSLALPKFKIESEIQLNDPLKELGLGGIFDGSNSDFSEMLKSPEPLVVSEVIQKAFIEVNEEGAEAAAATALVRVAMCRSFPPLFYCNHPFILMVSSGIEANHILFFGKVLHPKSDDSYIAPRAEPRDSEMPVYDLGLEDQEANQPGENILRKKKE